MVELNEHKPIYKKLHILLAEDDFADRLLFEEALTELPVNSDLTTVTNGEELIKWLDNNEAALPDVLFLDLNMPRKNGFAALAEIKTNTILQDLPVFIITTAKDKEMILRVYKDAAHYYIPKPISFQELKTLIYKALKILVDNGLKLPTKENFILSVCEND